MPCLLHSTVLEYKHGKGIHRAAVDQDIKLNKVCGFESLDLVVEGGIAAAYRFKPVIEIKKNFCQRHIVDNLNPLLIQIVHGGLHSPFLHAQCHDRPQIFGRSYD